MSNNFDVSNPNYLQNEQWFEITRIVNSNPDKGYILVINSYGRLRKLFNTGGYEVIHNGGEIKEHKS